MKTAIIAVGKEILTGRTVNTNLTTIARRLKEIGIDVSRSFVIDDIKEEYINILSCIDENLIIFTGGLGPTIDDITRETVLEFYQVETEVKQDVLQKIEDYFRKIEVKKRKSNDKQALFPKDSLILDNELGTAPGVLFEVDSKTIILFPGPPHEMKPMLDEVIEYLSKKMNTTVISKGFKLVGTGESTMEDKLTDFYPLYPTVSIAPYASPGEIKYVFSATDKEALDTCMSAFRERFNQYIYGSLEDTLEGVVVKQLRKQQKTISVVESCTGGLLASRITSVSGASHVFNISFVTYSNEAKMKYVHVDKEVLETHGAVSNETASRMAEGLHKETGADITIAITGIAGPTGGTPDKPIGLVHFGMYHNGSTKTQRRIFNGNRQMIQSRATTHALNMIRKELIE